MIASAFFLFLFLFLSVFCLNVGLCVSFFLSFFLSYLLLGSVHKRRVRVLREINNLNGLASVFYLFRLFLFQNNAMKSGHRNWSSNRFNLGCQRRRRRKKKKKKNPASWSTWGNSNEGCDCARRRLHRLENPEQCQRIRAE